jgi:5-enolpyruvylshikimate-3-phosphate synthase
MELLATRDWWNAAADLGEPGQASRPVDGLKLGRRGEGAVYGRERLHSRPKGRGG